MVLFSKALNRVDIEQGLALDHEFTAALPPLGNGQRMYLTVSDERRTVWRFLYSLNAAGSPKFTEGWIKFAENLNSGNKVYFYANDDDDDASGAQYRVVVRK